VQTSEACGAMRAFCAVPEQCFWHDNRIAACANCRRLVMTNVMEHAETQRPVEEERRSTARHRVLKGATLTFNSGYGSFECLARNLSERGAKLSFGDTSAVPAVFNLVIKGETGARSAHIRWRTITDIGVEFG
jgi:hypothetical protein